MCVAKWWCHSCAICWILAHLVLWTCRVSCNNPHYSSKYNIHLVTRCVTQNTRPSFHMSGRVWAWDNNSEYFHHILTPLTDHNCHWQFSCHQIWYSCSRKDWDRQIDHTEFTILIFWSIKVVNYYTVVSHYLFVHYFESKMGRRHRLVSTISPHKCEDVATLKITLLYIARVCWYYIGSGITCIVIGNWRRRKDWVYVVWEHWQPYT